MQYNKIIALARLLSPFEILLEIENCTPEITLYIITGQIWAVSSNSGWQTSNTFLIWTINFINRLSTYRLQLYEEIFSK